MDFADGIRKLVLYDGRALSYAIYGIQTPPSDISLNVFYFHGFAASRLEAAPWHDHAFSQKIRIIAPDRPGMGHSAMQKERRILDWPKDIEELADHLGIRQFSVLGVGGGAAYALACAREISTKRLKSVAVCSGIYPFSLGTQIVPFVSKMLLSAASWSPALATFALERWIGKAARDYQHPEIFEQTIVKDLESRPWQDKACFDNADFRRKTLASVREAFRVSAEGVAWEARLLAGDWGFVLESIERDKILLWHGKEDVNCPVAVVEKAQKDMKRSRLISLEDEAHISVPVKYGRKVLEGLMV
jgi:pimeloyl-ACP methyl ester carboxylesterase